LLHCTSNCRELQPLTCKWDIESLRQIIGSQARIYIRPIQKNLKVQSSSDSAATSLKSECGKCHKEFTLSDLREHILQCESESQEEQQVGKEDDKDDLPYLGITNHTQLQQEYDLDDQNISTSEPAEDTVSTEPQPIPSIDNDDINEVINVIVMECRKTNIVEPVDILRLCQSKIVTGIKLDIVDDSEVLEGGTSFILVNRDRLLPSAMEEIDTIPNLRLCLEVQFFGEVNI